MEVEVFQMERMQSAFESEVDINLSESGVHPMKVAEVLAEDGRALAERELGYPDPPGSPALRDNIATWYPGASLENVTVTNGGAEANFLSLWTLLNPGDRLAFMLPNYMQGWGIARAFADAIPFHLTPGNDSSGARWVLNVDELLAVVDDATKAILVCNPNNPTGAVLSEGEMTAVVEAAAAVDAWLIADEIYRGAELAGDETPTFWGRYPKTIITSGLSKAFGLPGLRLGWVVAPPEMIERIWHHRDYTTLMVGILSDALGAAAHSPQRRSEILDRTRSIVRRNAQVVMEWARSNDELVTLIPPRAGAIAYLEYKLDVPSEVLVDRVRREQSVLVVPGRHFGVEGGFRVGFGHSGDATVEGLSRIEKLFRQI